MGCLEPRVVLGKNYKIKNYNCMSKITKDLLEQLLREAEEKYKDESPDTPWVEYYAEYLYSKLCEQDEGGCCGGGCCGDGQ